MVIGSPSSGTVGHRTAVVSAALLVGAILLGVASLAGIPPAAPLPVVLGLAASDRPDRDPELERLASELESFVDDLEGRSAAAADGRDIRSADATANGFERDRDDEIGRLSAALDELTTTVVERERRFAERERELRRTNERLEALVEASPVPVVAIDTDGTVERWNPAAERVFGWREEAIVGDPPPFVPADRADEYDALRRRLLEGESLTGVETERLTSDGERVDVSLSAAPMRDDEGEVIGTMATLEDITERKGHRRELREINETLNAVIEASPAALVALDPDETVTLWNPAAERIFGWSEDEVVGEPLPFVPAERSDDHREIFDRLLDGETLTGVETRRQTRAGDPIDVSLSAAPIRDADGEIVGTMAAIEDVTDRKERERRLEATSARLEALFEHSPDMINVLDTDGTIVDVNRRFCEALGYSEDELLGTGIWTHERLFDADEVRAVLDETATGQRRKFEGRFRRSDGSTFPIEVHLIRVDLADENRFVAICRDITDRKERERDLRETKRRLELALEGSDTGVWEWDLATDELVWNETIERMVGLEPGSFEETVEGFRRRVHPDDWPRIETAVDDALESGELYETEFRIRHEDGHWIWVEVRGRFVTDDERRRMVGITSDVTDRKERERQLRDREAELQRYTEYTDDLLDAVDDVFYVIDADGDLQRWNESLAAVSGYADDEIESMNALEFFAEADRDPITDAIEDVLETGATRVEAPILTSDGESIPYEFVASRLEDLDGNTVVTGIGRNISERKRYERDLERATELLEQAQALASVGGWELDVRSDPPEATATDEFYRQLGLGPGSSLTPDEVISRFHPDDRARLRTALAAAIEDGERYDLEARVRPADGETRWVRAIGEPVFESDDGEGRSPSSGRARPDDGEEGTVAAVRGSMQDITESRERERQLSTLMSNVPGMVYRCRNEPEWPFEFVSEGSREVTGYEPETLVEGDVEWSSDVMVERHREIWETVQRALADREPFQVTYPIETADGDRRWLSERGRGVYTADGTLEALEGVITDVTDRVENERKLERTTGLLEQAQELASVGAWELDVRSEPYDLWWSEEVARIHGLESADAVGLDEAIEFYHPEDRETIRTAVERAIEDGERYDLEVRLLVDGETRWVRTIGRPVYEETGGRRPSSDRTRADDGEVVKIQGSLQEITDRKERERELERYETIVQAVGDPVYTLDAEGEIRFVNDAVESLAGYDPAELIGGDVSEVLPPEDLERAREQVRELLRESEPYGTVETDFVTADGDVIETETHVALLPMEDGEFAGTAGVVRDITDRKERERELERYETIIQAIGDPVYTLDAEGEFRFVNDAIEPLTGYDPETLIGRNVEDVMTASNLETARELIRDLLEDEASAATFEMDLLTVDGDVIEAENHMALLPTEDGEFAGTAGVVRDITDRKERERELERTTDLLERVQRMAKVGGWELPVDADPRTAIWTDEMYRLHDLPRDVEPDLEQTVRCYHPDDRPFVRERLETAIETGTGYDFEARIRTGEGDVRWVRAISEPIYDDDGTLRKYRGTVQDVSDRKRREMALESLHETARGLLNAETEATVAELVVDTAAELLESDDASASVYLLDSETNRFEPAASTPAFVDRSGGAPPIAVGDGDSVLWTTYVTGSQTVVDDAEAGDRSPLFGGDAPGGLLVPIGDYGVFVLLASPAAIDEESRRLFETLVATTEAAFDRLESEANLRERDAELAARNRRLRRQIQITEIIRGIDRSLIGADGREEIERTVPRRLVEADAVSFAWIGDLDASGSTLEPRTWAGDEPEYLDAIDFDLDREGDSPEPAVRAARSETPTVVENVVEGLQGEPWRRNAIDAGFQSVVAVPLTYEEYGYGVLTVYADEPDAFTELERSVFAELGEGIANAINAAQTQEALHAETLVELTLDLDADDVLSRIAATTGGTVSYEGLGAHDGSETVLFFEVSDAPSDAVRDALEELVSVRSFRLVTESETGRLFEATVTGDVLASRLVRHGGSPRSITADGDGTVVTVDVPVTTDVREFVEMLAEEYDGAELRSRRHVQRAMQTRGELVTSLFEELTDRQLEVLRTAYLAGFFEWPRESTGEEIADMLDVTQPTVNRHLRIGQQRLLAQLFGNETRSPADGA